MKLSQPHFHYPRIAGICFTLGWLMVAAGCAIPFGSAQQNFQLLPPDSLSQSATVLLKMDSEEDSIRRHWEAVLNMDAAQTVLILLDPLGQRLATLGFDGEQLTIEHSRPIDISLKKLLGELQMVLWPLSALNADKWNQGWHFEEQNTIRRVYYQQQYMAEIHRQPSSQWSGKFDYSSKTSDYRLHIQSSPLD